MSAYRNVIPTTFDPNNHNGSRRFRMGMYAELGLRTAADLRRRHALGERPKYFDLLEMASGFENSARWMRCESGTGRQA